MDDFSEHAKRQYQESKKMKKTKITLDKSQVITFAELLSRNSPLVDYEHKLNLVFADVERQKEVLGLYTPEDAKAFLKAIKASDDFKKYEEQQMAEKKRIAEAEQREAALKEEQNKPKRKRGRPRKKKEYNTANMQKKLDKQQPKPKSNFRADNEEEFKNDSRKGICFLMDKYGVKRQDILAELLRLKINADLLPR